MSERVGVASDSDTLASMNTSASAASWLRDSVRRSSPVVTPAPQGDQGHLDVACGRAG